MLLYRLLTRRNGLLLRIQRSTFSSSSSSPKVSTVNNPFPLSLSSKNRNYCTTQYNTTVSPIGNVNIHNRTVSSLSVHTRNRAHFSTIKSTSSSSSQTVATTTVEVKEEAEAEEDTTAEEVESAVGFPEDDQLLSLVEIDVCMGTEYVEKLAKYADHEAETIKSGELIPEDWTEEEKDVATETFYDDDQEIPTFSLGAMLNLIHLSRPLKLRSTKKVFADTGIIILSKRCVLTTIILSSLRMNESNMDSDTPTPSLKQPLPDPLRLSLVTAINNYSKKPTTRIDYHPGSNNRVQDIVHPSLYPYVHGLSVITEGEDNTTKTTTTTTDTSTTTTKKSTDKPVDISIFDSLAYNFITRKENKPPQDPDDIFDYAENLDHFGRSINYSPTYQWLPSEFYVNKEGKVTINSYINNLPTEETELYTLISQAFEFLVPYFELTWSHGKHTNYNGVRNNFSDGGGYESIPTGIGALRDKHLQVITKIVRIRVDNSRENDNNHLKGAWHAEGMSNEFIMATGSITLQQSSALSTTLKFKRNYTEDEAGSLVTAMGQDPSEYISNFLRKELVPLGTMDIEEGDIVVFPNSHIHKLDVYNISSVQPAERTILVFWLVDPSKRIVSTKHVKEQQTTNPLFTFDKALEHRLNLMKERSKVKQQYQQAELNLCEH